MQSGTDFPGLHPGYGLGTEVLNALSPVPSPASGRGEADRGQLIRQLDFTGWSGFLSLPAMNGLQGWARTGPSVCQTTLN